MNRILYCFKEAFRGMYEARLMTVVAVFSIAVALFITGLIATAYWNVRSVTQSVLAQTDMVVYCFDRTAADSAGLRILSHEIATLPQVQSSIYIDRGEAWRRFSSQYGTQMLAAIDSNPFPASFELVIKPAYKRSAAMTGLQQTLQQLSGVESVTYSSAWIAGLERFRLYFYGGSVVIAVFVFIIMHVIITNTIKLTIYARRELISAMRYVGATNLYIQMPFVLEGMLQGGIGGLIAWLCIDIVRLSLYHLPLVWIPWYCSILLVGLGMAFGFSGSLSAIRKFLR